MILFFFLSRAFAAVAVGVAGTTAVDMAGVEVTSGHSRTPAGSSLDEESGILRQAESLPAENTEQTNKSASSARPRRLSETDTVTCQNAGSKKATVTVNEYTLQAQFTCGEGVTTLSPAFAANQNKCFTKEACTESDQGVLKEVLGVDATLTQPNTSEHTFKVALTQMPSERAGKAYFKCGDNAASNHCIVTVQLPAAPGEDVCIPNKTINKTISKSTTTAQFVCKQGTLQPAGLKEVLKPQSCTSEGEKLQLEKLVPGAQLAYEDSSKTYTLTVPTLPSQKQQFCYTCVYGGESIQPCKVIVTVEAGESSGSATTAAPTATTTSYGAAVSPAFASALALVSAAGLNL